MRTSCLLSTKTPPERLLKGSDETAAVWDVTAFSAIGSGSTVNPRRRVDWSCYFLHDAYNGAVYATRFFL